MANRVIEVKGFRIAMLGDPHLGRKFENNVPLHRRGEREEMQWADLARSLETDCDVHVCMGDLFDKWFVSYDAIARAASIYLEASIRNSERLYYVLQGNHDASRDLERHSAFALFRKLLGDQVVVLGSEPEGFVLTDQHGSSLYGVCLPWHPVLSALELVEAHANEISCADIVFGHWDVVAIGENPNIIPAAKLKELGVKQAATGHDHTARDMVIDGLPVIVTGSMQPYSFAEDPDGKLYVTLTLPELKTKLDGNPDALKDKCVRVILQPGEVIDFAVNALMLKPIKAIEAREEGEAVEFAAFDFEHLFQQAMTAAGVNEEYIDLARSMWNIERAKT